MKPNIVLPIGNEPLETGARGNRRGAPTRIALQPNGNRVRELREIRGWTQRELAERADCSKRTIEHIEAAAKSFRPSMLAAVAKELGVSVETITVQSYAVVELNLDRPLDPLLKEQESLLRALKDRLFLVADPRVISTPSDGVVITLQLAKEDCDRLIWAVPEGRLRDLGIRAARLMTDTDVVNDALPYSGPHLLPQPHLAANASKCSLLVVEDEPTLRDYLRRLLEPQFEVTLAETTDAAENVFRSGPVDLILTDQRVPGRTGVQLLEWVRQHYPRTIRLLMTGYDDIEHIIDAINRGQVYHYFTKPLLPDLLPVLLHAAEKFALEKRHEELLGKLRRANHKLRRVNHRLRQRLERQAVTDALTGVVFNHWFIEGLARNEIKGRRSPLSIGLIDADEFEEDVVKAVARILHRTLRVADSVGRWERATFLVIAPQTGEGGATKLAERIRAAISRDTTCNVAIGFAVADVGVNADLEAMTEMASAALAESKLAGGNRYAIQSLCHSEKEPGTNFHRPTR